MGTFYFPLNFAVNLKLLLKKDYKNKKGERWRYMSKNSNSPSLSLVVSPAILENTRPARPGWTYRNLDC